MSVFLFWWRHRENDESRDESRVTFWSSESGEIRLCPAYSNRKWPFENIQFYQTKLEVESVVDSRHIEERNELPNHEDTGAKNRLKLGSEWLIIITYYLPIGARTKSEFCAWKWSFANCAAKATSVKSTAHRSTNIIRYFFETNWTKRKLLTDFGRRITRLAIYTVIWTIQSAQGRQMSTRGQCNLKGVTCPPSGGQTQNQDLLECTNLLLTKWTPHLLQWKHELWKFSPRALQPCSSDSIGWQHLAHFFSISIEFVRSSWNSDNIRLDSD